MKNKYFIKTTGIVLTLGLLLLFGGLQAQNRYYLDFDGSNDYVKYSDDATLGRMDGATDYTIEAWIYPVDGRVAEYDRVLQRYYSFAIVMYDGNNDGNVEDWYFQVYDKGSSSWKYYNTEGDATLTLDSWNHIAVINNSSDGSLKLFVNGVDVTTTGGYSNRSLPSSSSNDNLYIGQKGNGASYFGGYIDEVRLKNIAVNSSDLHYNTYNNQYESDDNTAGLFHFNEGSGTNTENVASGSDATLNNGVTWRAWDYVSSHLPLAYEWTGGTDTDWGTAGNWDSGSAPSDNTKDVIIPSSLTNYPVIGTSTEADCNNLLLETGATLEISSSSSGTGSLIIAGDLTNNGTITVNRYMTAYTSDNDGWHFLSAPVSSFTIAGSDFEPAAGDDDLYEYDETAASENWLNYNGGTFGDTDFEVGKGYLCAYKTVTTKQFTGDINTGSYTKNLSYTTGASSPGWNLLGNPYTAAIDWDDISKTASVDGTVYVMRASDGQYIDWNGSAGDLSGGIIPAMQGFFVKATATGQSITMDPADETHSTGTYYKSTGFLAENTIKINVSGASGESNEYIQFRKDATLQFDHSCDAYKLFGFSKAPQIYTNDGEELYSINCLPISMKNYDLPLGIKIVDEGDYTLSFEGINNILDKFEIDLEDTQTGTTETVTPGFSYTFSYKEGDNPDRFVLHFYNVTATPEIGSESSTMIYAYQSSIIVKSFEKPLNGKVEVINLLGQTVYKQQISGTGFVSLRPQLENGAYIVRYRGNDGTVQSNKVIL